MSIAKIFFELPTGKRLLKEAAREMTKEAIEKVEKAEAALEKAEKAAAEAEKAADEATANAVDEAMRKLARKATLRLLRNRFGSIPKTLIAKINAIEDQDQLDALLTLAGTCADLKAFRSRLD